MAQLGAQLLFEIDQAQQFFRPMEAEDQAAARIGFQRIGELGFDTGGFVGEGQWLRRAGRALAVYRQAIGQAECVLGRLQFDALERVAFALGLDHAGHLAIDIEQVIGEAGFQRELAHRDAGAGVDVHVATRLHQPAASMELAVYFLAGKRFRVGWVGRHWRELPCCCATSVAVCRSGYEVLQRGTGAVLME